MGKQTNKKVNQHRRRALFGTATGAALVAVWHKPIVSSVVSPAHAQMSEDEFGIDSGTVFIDLNRNQNQGQTSSNQQQRFSPLDLLISPAHAGGGSPGRNADVKATYMGGGMFDYEHVNRNGSVKRTGMVAFGEINEVDIVENCSNNNGRGPGQHSVEILAASADGVTLRITTELPDNGNKNGNEPGDTTYFLEPGDATLETNCDDENGQAPF